ncbi:MAG: response regulator [SAR324 cluster bacterium]|nr:response regulator [SAR324 cluster bacterium]
MKILIVEKKKFLFQQLTAEFTRGNDQIFNVFSEFEALEVFQGEKPDLVIMDAEEETINVLEITARIRGKSKSEENYFDSHTPILFIGTQDVYPDQAKAEELGVTDFYSRTFFTNDLKNLVRGITIGAQPRRFSDVTVLVVDDNDVTVELLKKVLIAEGITVLNASNGIEALGLIAANQDVLDLVLTDYSMPKMDGLELCHKIREDQRNQNLPIIFLSGVAEMDFIIKIYRAGASDYLPKPFSKEELLARFNVHLESRRLNQSLKDKLAESKKHDMVKNRLLGITSHDLRSPLNGIIGIAKLLLEDEDLTPSQAEMVQLINQSGDFLLEFIQELLTLSKIYEEEKLQPNSFSLKQIVKSSIESNIHSAFFKKIVLCFNNQAGDVTMNSEAKSLMRILNNLITNAIKFTKEKGTVEVRLHPLQDATVTISVIDTGIGIAEEFLPTLFSGAKDYLREGTNHEQSTGFGLSIISELIKRLGGTVAVTSKENEGSTFTITLPQGVNS